MNNDQETLETDSHRLPEKYHSKHEWSLVLHDTICHMLSQYGEGDAFLTEFKLTSDADQQSLEKDMWEWLKHNGHEETVIFKAIVPALVADFLHFLHTALESSAKGNMSVAYSLFRKPFYDHLFFFEWLVSDQNTFLTEFLQQSSSQNIDAVHVDDKKDGRRKKLIELTLAEIGRVFPDSVSPIVLNTEFLCDIRYNKDCKWGFQTEWNTATHLITTHKKWTTEPTNFNFVFVGDVERESLWNHLYNKLPLLLMYSLETLMVIFNRIHPLNPDAIADVHKTCVEGMRMMSIEAGFDFDGFIAEEVDKFLKNEGQNAPSKSEQKD